MSAEIPSHRLKRAKRALRREILGRRDALAPSERAERSARIRDRLLALPELERASMVMAFWSFGSEVDTGPILAGLEERAVGVALPRIEGDDLVALRYRRGDPLVGTAFGAREPARGTALAPSDLDVVVVPGVAFDRMGHRIGYGRGFYDRFLRSTPAFRVAVAFDLQVVDRVPHGRADVPVDAVVTEREVIRRPS